MLGVAVAAVALGAAVAALIGVRWLREDVRRALDIIGESLDRHEERLRGAWEDEGPGAPPGA